MSGYRPSSVISIILGIILFLILIIAFLSLADVTKAVGYGLMFLPNKLGWVDVVQPDQILALHLQTSPPVVKINQPGRYAVYTADYDLLVITDQLQQSESEPWIKVSSPNEGVERQLTYVTRGLRPYDTLFAKGRPIFTFRIEAPGQYQLVAPRRNAVISIVPDYTSGREKTIVFLMVVEVALLLLLPLYFFNKHRQKQLAKIREVKQLKRTQRDIITELRQKKDQSPW